MTKVCPKCGNSLNQDGYCAECNISFEVYDKIKQTSKGLYNQGLQLSKARDLSGAIQLLQRSLKFDKNNIDARNLLGLVYFEVGETVQALQQWVISKNLQPIDNAAQEYLNSIQQNPTYLEKLNSAIKKYNQALAHIQQKNDDLAIIQLKKVISINPKLLKAYSLLALCYIEDGQIENAQEVLTKALKIDKNNYIARKYYEEITQEPLKIEDVPRSKVADKPIKVNPVRTSSNPSFFQVGFIGAGFLIGLLFALFLISPAQQKANKNEISTLNEQLGSSQTKLEETLSMLDKETANKASLEQENDDLHSKLHKAEMLATESTKILTALQYQRENKLVDAANLLYSVDVKNIEGSGFESTYNQLKTSIYEKVALDSYNTGYSYRNTNYARAIEQFDLSLKLIQDAYYSDRALYYRGIAQFNSNNYEAAKKDLELLLTQYPNSARIEDAKYYLTQIPVDQ